MKTKPCCWAAVLTVSLGIAACVQAASTVQFTATSYTVGESDGFARITVQRLNDLSTTVSVDYATTDGTATNGVKYSAAASMLTFEANVTNQTIAVPILKNGIVDGTKNFRVILSNPSGGALLGPQTNATVSITDNDAGIQFQFGTYSVAEDAGAVRIGIVRGDDGLLPVTVNLATTDLVATNRIDYTGTTNTLSFAPQERLKFVPIPILNNSLKQGNRSFRVTLANPTGTSLGSQTTATVTIVDNDPGFSFQFATYAVAEDAGVVQIAVLRGSDDTNSTASVDFATSDLTASDGLDYVGGTKPLAFAAGEKAKLVSVPILNDGLKEPTENFQVTLTHPIGGVLGSLRNATVSILDNDGGVAFELSSYSMWENAGLIKLTILRGNDVALGPITVDYATSDGTAKAGQDYQDVARPIAFQENETVKTISVPILQNALVTNATSFAVALSNATGGAVLGMASTTVRILDATGLGTYRTVAPPFDTALTIRGDGDLNILSWAGRGQLQRADTTAGPWQTLTNATSPFTVQSPIPTTYYRVTRPRPVEMYIPSSYDGRAPVPLVILLHRYSQSGTLVESETRFQRLAEARGFLYCYPDSAIDRWGYEYWNATDGCCDFEGIGIDDAAYLRALIEETIQQFAVDRKRIYFIGVSNGAFMAYRMACQSADLVAGIASFAGVTFLDPGRCRPVQPVNVLHIHPTSDDIVAYAGGSLLSRGMPFLFPSNLPQAPGALQTVEIWAAYNGARDPLTDVAPSLDLDLDLPGPDTVVTRYANSPPGGAVELWTINRGEHSPTFYSGSASSEFAPRVIDWLLAHPKP